jgi:hypothetical protein
VYRWFVHKVISTRDSITNNEKPQPRLVSVGNSHTINYLLLSALDFRGDEELMSWSWALWGGGGWILTK